MRFVSVQTMNAWKSTWKGGATRAIARATIEEFLLETTAYDGSTQPTSNGVPARQVKGVFATGVFNPGRTPKELPNIKDVSWSRTVDQDAATITMTLWNTEPLPIGEAPVAPYTFDIPGYYTAGRGSSGEPSEWGNVQNEWRGMIAPDRVVRLFEGYGCDPTLPPEKDPHLYPAGVFLIDTVNYTDDGLIVIEGRDLARLLMEQIAMPPVIPQDEYPVSFISASEAASTQGTTTTTTTPTFTIGSSAWKRPTYATDSNQFWVGKSITDDLGRPMVDNQGGVSGHYGRQAFDADPNSYWLSVGAAYSDVPRYIEGTIPTSSVYAVSVKPWGGAVTCYVSVQINGVWQGTPRVPYINGHDQLVTNATIPYVAKQNVNSGVYTTINLPRQPDGVGPLYSNVTRVRFTFTGLHQYGTGKYNWRVGLWDAYISEAADTPATSGPAASTDLPSIPPMIYFDYTTIAKYFAAWGGFYWSPASSGRNVLNYSDGSSDTIDPGASDPDLPGGGAMWGDFANSGTAGVVSLPVSEFDKRPLLDCISYVRDILQYNLFVDECGGIIWRTPNIWEIGNYVSPIRPTEGRRNGGRTTDVLDIKDDETILRMSVKLNSRNVRETVFVGNTTGSLGATAKLVTNNTVGPFQTNMRRSGGWTDQNFASPKECLVMAELIMLRQLFTYRTNQISIPANPAIQVDDQIRVWDRVAAETFLHYVAGISSKLDMSQGTWTYDLSTHWLGTDPFSDWAFRPGDLSTDTRAQQGVTGTTATAPVNTAADYGWFWTGTSSYTVTAIAQRYNITEEAIRTINGSALNGVTTVGTHYWVRVRSEEHAVVTPAESTYSSYGWLQCNTSRTVADIASSYSVTVSELRSWNTWLTGDSVSGGAWVKIRSNAVLLRTTAS